HDRHFVTIATQGTTTQPPPLSSILTIRPSPDPNGSAQPILPGEDHSPAGSTTTGKSISTIMAQHPEGGEDLLGTSSILSIDSLDSYHTAAGRSSIISSALATEGGSTIKSLHGNYASPLVHRFTLIKPGAKPNKKPSGSGTVSPPRPEPVAAPVAAGWNPFDLFFSSGLLVQKCDICWKRLGWKPVLECDDCGLMSFP
ncbi:hypothetical protein MPER_01325, partial [Moniliophthora perniciosa FA553]